MEGQFPPNHRSAYSGHHGVISQKRECSLLILLEPNILPVMIVGVPVKIEKALPEYNLPFQPSCLPAPFCVMIMTTEIEW
jgi:hypothetical protein